MKRRSKRPLSPAERARLGGLARAKKLSAKQRRVIAKQAGLANADRIAKLRAELDGYRANSAKQEEA